MITIADESNSAGAKIKVIGVGGCGNNAINTLITKGINGVELIAVNTDVQALSKCLAPIKIQAGKTVTRGLGTGADPEKGQKAIEECKDEIARLVEGSDLVFVTAGMGKGTGTGGAPMVAKIAKSAGALVVAVVTTPFDAEGNIRKKIAEEGIEKLRRYVDTLIVINNQKLLTIAGNDDILSAMNRGNQVLCNAVRGISDIILKPGLINVDFADVKAVMQDKGDALIGSDIGRGENRALEAIQKAISNPLLEGVSLTGAKGILINITGNLTGNKKIAMNEVNEILKFVTDKTGEDVNLIYGVVPDDSLNEDELMVTVIATGFGQKSVAQQHAGKIVKKLTAEESTPLSQIDNEIEVERVPAFVRKAVKIQQPKIEEEAKKEGKQGDDDEPLFLRQVAD